MKKIVVIAKEMDNLQELINSLRALFPECEICIVREEDGVVITKTPGNMGHQAKAQSEK